jgi:hypothetical protein
MSDQETIVLPLYQAMCDLAIIIKKTVQQAVAEQAANIGNYAAVKDDLHNISPEFMFYIAGGALIFLGEMHFAPTRWPREKRESIIRELAKTTVRRLMPKNADNETEETFRNAFEIFSKYCQSAFIEGDPEMLTLFLTKLTPAFALLQPRRSGDTTASSTIQRRFQEAVVVFCGQRFEVPAAKRR